MKVVENFIRFPERSNWHSYDKQRVRYACFTALLFVQLAGKVQNNYLLVYPTYISCLDLMTRTLVIPLSFEDKGLIRVGITRSRQEIYVGYTRR